MGTVKINEAEKERLSLPLTALDADHVAQDIKSKSEIPRITDGIYEVAIQEIMDKPPKEAEPETPYEQAGAGAEEETVPKRPEAAPREEANPEPVLHKKAEEENPARRDDHPEGSSRKAEAAKAESSKPAAKVHKPAQPEASSTEKERESSRKAAASEPGRKPAPAKARARKPEEEGKRTIVRPAAEKKKPEALHTNAAAEAVSRKIPAAEKSKPEALHTNAAAEAVSRKVPAAEGKKPEALHTKVEAEAVNRKIPAEEENKPEDSRREPKFDESGKTAFMTESSSIDPVLKDLSTGAEIALDRNPFIVGKLPSCDLCIASKVVSRRHAEIRQDHDRVYVKDLGSLNGTFLQGFRLPPDTEMEVKSGQTVVFANKQYRIRW